MRFNTDIESAEYDVSFYKKRLQFATNRLNEREKDKESKSGNIQYIDALHEYNKALEILNEKKEYLRILIEQKELEAQKKEREKREQERAQLFSSLDWNKIKNWKDIPF